MTLFKEKKEKIKKKNEKKNKKKITFELEVNEIHQGHNHHRTLG